MFWQFLNSYIAPRHLLLLFLCSIVLLLPAMLLGPGGHDLQCQSIWIKNFSVQFWHGNLYPRWLMDMQAGRGSPVFFYYPPLAYFITALFYFLSPWMDFAYLQIAAGAWLAVWLSGITFYLWIRRQGADSMAALVSGLLYMVLPEHVAINFYSYLMPSTMWVYVWVPLLFMSASHLMQGRQGGVFFFAMTVCLMILTNIPQLVIWGIVVMLYCFALLKRQTSVRQLARLSCSGALGLALAAFYLVPMLSYRDFVNAAWQKTTVQLGPITVDKAQYVFFLGNPELLNVGLSAIFLVSIGLLGLFYSRSAAFPRRNFFMYVSLVSFIAMLPQTMPLWMLLPIFIIQFAARLFTITTFCIACFAAFSQTRLRWFSYILIVLCLGFGVVWPHYSRVTLEQLRIYAPQIYRQYMLNIDQFPDYLTTPDLYAQYNAYGYEYNPKTGPASATLVPLPVALHKEKIYVSGDAKVVVKKWQPRSILIYYKATMDSQLLIRQFMFPGFRAFIGDKELELARDDKTGQIVINVPPGEGDISLELMPLIPEILGKVISIFALAVMLLLALLQARKRQTLMRRIA